MKTIFFFDIDSTLYRPDLHFVPVRVIAALKSLLEQGHEVWLVSSRSLYETRPLEKSFLSLPFTGIVLEGGALVLNEKREPVLEKFIPETEVEKIRDYCSRHNLLWRYSCPSSNSYARKADADERFKVQRLYLCTPDEQPYTGQPCYNLLVWADEAMQHELASALENCSVVFYPECMEIRHQDASKEQAVQDILSGRDLPSAAFGDGMNDIGMLQTVDTGVAVGNACQALKEAADEICGSVEEEGVAVWLQEKGYIENEQNTES